MRKPFILTSLAILLHSVLMAQSVGKSTLIVPVTINLKPLYALAERSVDSIYTSEGYPEGWQQEECEIRYKYTFRRGPLEIKAKGNKFQLGFLGYFRVVGSVRACFNNKPITGWTPSCRCGFDEGEIPVRVQFTGQLSLLQNYQLKLELQVQEPKPQGKCEVCFWKQDITSKVMQGIQQELALAKKEIEKKYALIDFRTEFGKLWEELQTPFGFPGLGYLYLRPEAVHVNQFSAREDSLHVEVGLSANPILTLHKETVSAKPLSPIKPSPQSPGFSIEVEARLQYDSLTAILQRNLNGQLIPLKKGLIQKKFIVDSIFLKDSYSSRCMLKVHFSGSDRGIAYLRAQPIYDSIRKEIWLETADITIHSDNKLIDLTDKLFQQKLKATLTEKSKFPLKDYFDIAKKKLEAELNREWLRGVTGKGNVTDMRLGALEAESNHIKVSLVTKGQLSVTVSEASLSL